MYPPVRMTRRAVEDRTTWSRSWTGTYPFTRTETEIDDVACHEGNYAVPNVLRGSRTQVKPSPRFAISAQLLHVADLRQVHADEAVFRRPVYVFESRIPNHFIRFVRRRCMHRSRVCFIRPGQQDQELGAAGRQSPPCDIPKRALLVDGMYDNLMQRHEHHLLAFQCQGMESPRRFSITRFQTAEHNRGLNVCGLAIAYIGDAEFEEHEVPIRCNDGVSAEHDLGPRT